MFNELAKEVCNGCDLITSEENKLTTKDLSDAGVLTLDDFATCEIDGETVGVITLKGMEGKFYWGGKAITNMVVSFISACGGEDEARSKYAEEKKKEPVKFTLSITKTKVGRDFTKVTIV